MSTGDGSRARLHRPNVRLRQARLRTPSPTDPHRPMSQRELAEALTEHVFRTTTRVVPLDRHYVSRVERGVRRYPTADYRAAFRAVLGVATDAELGFIAAQRGRLEDRNTRERAVMPAVHALPTGVPIGLVPTRGVTLVVVVASRRVLVALVDR